MCWAVLIGVLVVVVIVVFFIHSMRKKNKKVKSSEYDTRNSRFSWCFFLFCYNLILIKFYLANEEEKEEKNKAFTQRSSWWYLRAHIQRQRQ